MISGMQGTPAGNAREAEAAKTLQDLLPMLLVVQPASAALLAVNSSWYYLLRARLEGDWDAPLPVAWLEERRQKVQQALSKLLQAQPSLVHNPEVKSWAAAAAGSG